MRTISPICIDDKFDLMEWDFYMAIIAPVGISVKGMSPNQTIMPRHPPHTNVPRINRLNKPKTQSLGAPYENLTVIQYRLCAKCVNGLYYNRVIFYY